MLIHVLCVLMQEIEALTNGDYTELILHALTFIAEYDPPLTLEECIHFRRVLHLVFRTLVDSVPYFWSRILITPTTHLVYAEQWFALAQSYPLNIHVRTPSSYFFLASDHDGFNIWEHFACLLKLIAASFSTCTNLVLETAHPDLLRIATDELRPAIPTVLQRMSVVMAHEYPPFRNFQPQVLTDFVFLDPASFGQPFRPFSRLSIVHADVNCPVFSYIAADCSVAVVQLPHTYSLDWRDLIRLGSVFNSPANYKRFSMFRL
ncbi:hypothetical protein C8J57DRAFT_1502660 [Mycena rebaudengoi]|nr:hypothetical protein C8J57DRAFT_1502660 [Mycena rebaudengoi]